LGVGEQGSVDDVGEAPLEGSERFGLGVVVVAETPFEVGAGVVVTTDLGDRDEGTRSATKSSR
jgi:hypothetical protein